MLATFTGPREQIFPFLVWIEVKREHLSLFYVRYLPNSFEERAFFMQLDIARSNLQMCTILLAQCCCEAKEMKKHAELNRREKVASVET